MALAQFISDGNIGSQPESLALGVASPKLKCLATLSQVVLHGELLHVSLVD